MDQIIQEAIEIYNANKSNGPAMAIYAAIRHIKDAAGITPAEAKGILDEAMQGDEEYQQLKAVAHRELNFTKRGISMKLNSNTVRLGEEQYQTVEGIIKRIASENKIENVESVSIALDPTQGIINFKVKEIDEG